MEIAVVGSNGFVGSEIASTVASNDQYHLIRVVRGDDPESLLSSADVVIHSANPAGRFEAKKDPETDFNETVEKTAEILKFSQNKKFILISSLSCRTQMHLSYGRHRRACEVLALTQNATVVRLGPMYGGNRTRDSLHDIIAGRMVYVAKETQYAYVDVAWLANKILSLVEKEPQFVEIGAKNSISLAEIQNRFLSPSEFCGLDDTQIPQECPDGPDARLVLDYAQRELERIAQWK
jgi:nucleoside-diphosphate-sugar epimerase